MSTDRFTVRTVVLALAILVVGLAAAEVVLAVIHTPTPNAVDDTLKIGLGALTAMLARTSVSDNDEPAPTKVVNVSTIEALDEVQQSAPKADT